MSRPLRERCRLQAFGAVIAVHMNFPCQTPGGDRNRASCNSASRPVLAGAATASQLAAKLGVRGWLVPVGQDFRRSGVQQPYPVGCWMPCILRALAVSFRDLKDLVSDDSRRLRHSAEIVRPEGGVADGTGGAGPRRRFVGYLSLPVPVLDELSFGTVQTHDRSRLESTPGLLHRRLARQLLYREAQSC